MNDLREHEKFEMEALSVLQSSKILDSMIFGGGTMLRLCFELPRYSVDLDFCFKDGITQERQKNLCKTTKKALQEKYEITDLEEKTFTHLFELRTPKYPRRLKIEIRKENIKNAEIERNIAFSPFSNIQVQLDTFSLSQMAKNKIEAFMDRYEIRDIFDLEWILRHEPDALVKYNKEKRRLLKEKIQNISKKDIKRKLGILLEPKERAFYEANGFIWLERKLESEINDS